MAAEAAAFTAAVVEVFTVAAGVAFTVEVAAGSMAAGVVSTPVAEDIVVAAPSGARGLSVAVPDLSAEEATAEAEAFVADQRRDATEQAGDPTAGSVPRAA